MEFSIELQNMDVRLTEMEEKINSMDEKMKSIDTKLSQVIDAIMGNSLTKHGGFVTDIDMLKAKIEIMEKKQERYENFKNRIIWTVGIAGFIILGLMYLTNIYANIKRI